MPNKHIPERTCIGCRCKKPKAELLRFAFDAVEQRLAFDLRKKLPGRGAYLCRDENCLHLTLRQHSLDRAYRTKVPKSCYQQLEKLFNDVMNEIESHGEIGDDMTSPR